ncbi:MAG: preprotein translocase subunit YajC [Bacteroidota bacterium]
MIHFIAMAPNPSDPSSSMFSTLIMFALIIGIFYFMIIRPQGKQRKEREKMLGSVKKGDKVVTAGGVHGLVAGTDEKIILLEIADNVKVKVDRTAITAVVRESEPEGKKGK